VVWYSIFQAWLWTVTKNFDSLTLDFCYGLLVSIALVIAKVRIWTCGDYHTCDCRPFTLDWCWLSALISLNQWWQSVLRLQTLQDELVLTSGLRLKALNSGLVLNIGLATDFRWLSDLRLQALHSGLVLTIGLATDCWWLSDLRLQALHSGLVLNIGLATDCRWLSDLRLQALHFGLVLTIRLATDCWWLSGFRQIDGNYRTCDCRPSGLVWCWLQLDIWLLYVVPQVWSGAEHGTCTCNSFCLEIDQCWLTDLVMQV
jgi:hypothetical protein